MEDNCKTWSRLKGSFNLKQDVSKALVALQNHNKNEQIYPDATHTDRNL